MCRGDQLLTRWIANPSLSGEESGLWAITDAPLASASFPSATRREGYTMNESTARNLTRFKYAPTLLGAMAVFALAPATAHAVPVNNSAGDGGCHYTDKDGYDIPIDDGQSVLVDGKTVSCSGGTITVSFAPKPGGAGAQQQQ